LERLCHTGIHSFFPKSRGNFCYLWGGADAVAIQSDGKIVAAGHNTDNHTVTLIRYNKDSSLDSSFSDDGIQETSISYYYLGVVSIAIQSDGKIITGGSASDTTALATALGRYNTDGNADTTFSKDGIQMTNFSIASIAIQKMEK